MLKVIIEQLLRYMMQHVVLFLSGRVSIQYNLGFMEYPSIRRMQGIVEWESFICVSDLDNGRSISLASSNDDILL